MGAGRGSCFSIRDRRACYSGLLLCVGIGLGWMACVESAVWMEMLQTSRTGCVQMAFPEQSSMSTVYRHERSYGSFQHFIEATLLFR